MKNKNILSLTLFLLSLLLSPDETLAQSPGIKIFSGAKVSTTGASTIIINNGNFINNGTFSASGLNMVTFEGSASQAIEGTGTTVFSNLTINNSENVILNGNIISVSGVLLCNGPLISNGNLKLLSTAEGTALISGAGTGEVSGNVTMERYLPSEFGYKYFSSPFQAATVNEFGDDMNLASSSTSFYRYDENRLVGGFPASGWINYKATVNVLNPMAGYAVNFGNADVPNTVDVTGVVNNGSLSQLLYNHNNTYTKGFNLVGNPYPSPVDWNAVSGWTRTNIDNALYFFKASTTEQYGGTYSTLINGNSSDGLASNIIPSMQGFMVHVTDGLFPVSGVLQMDNNTRVTNQSQPFIKGKSITSLLRFTANFTNNPDSPLSRVADYPVEIEVGPEFVTGSTRMKSGTSQKLVLNMISTAVMIQLGRVEDNKMVNMQLTNEKLVDRGTKMLMEKLKISNYDNAKELLLKYGSVKKAVENSLK